MFELDGVSVLKHNSIKIKKEKIIYIDPFQIDIPLHDADLILCTHSHYDHFSPKDILAVANESTVIITTQDCKPEIEKMGFLEENVYYVKDYEEFNFEDIQIKTIPAYNKYKEFHPKSNKWVGYLIKMEGIRYYIAGDTDKTREASHIECDVAFLPVGGTYTMDYIEAASLTRKIKPKFVIPTHYGSVVGDIECGILFKELINEKETKCELYI